MKLVFDINHPAHINFFKHAIFCLNKSHEVFVFGLRRGKIPDIIKNELCGINYKFIGRHRGSYYSIIFEANIFKFFKLIYELLKIKPDIGISVGGFLLGAAMKLLGKKNIQFDDDPESSKNIFLEKLTASKLFIPKIDFKSTKIKHFNASKEWAYLSPKYFTPDISTLDMYHLRPKNYIFIREVSTGSLNYKKQKENIIQSFSQQLPMKYKVLLSLEDKSFKDSYPEDWIILEEPVQDIHSLIYYSQLLLSSGDSIAREGAILGVTSIYCGYRDMKVNDFIAEYGKFHKLKSEEVVRFINNNTHNFTSPDGILYLQEQYRTILLKEWDDITELIVNEAIKI